MWEENGHLQATVVDSTGSNYVRPTASVAPKMIDSFFSLSILRALNPSAGADRQLKCQAERKGAGENKFTMRRGVSSSFTWMDTDLHLHSQYMF